MLGLALFATLAPVEARAACGNGIPEVSESCDDANLDPGDGCDATCQTEEGWVCTIASLEARSIEPLFDEEDYRGGFHQEPQWTLSATGLQVTQENNAKASIYLTSLGINEQTFEMRVRAGGNDDDVFGWTLGFRSGDHQNKDADWLLIDWNRSERRSKDCRAPAGLALNRVTGPITALDDLWCHTDVVQELSRGNISGLLGWTPDTLYTIRIEYTRTRLLVYLDNQLEFDMEGRFPLGDFGLYALSQSNLTFDLISPANYSACAGLDSDDDGLSDPLELRLGLNPSHHDSDLDGIPDALELSPQHNPPDTDQDGVINALDADDEGDGVPSRSESMDGDTQPMNDDLDRDGIPNYLDGDDDGDGIPTSDEVYGAATPLDQDSDLDGVPDFADRDDDGDGVPTRIELRLGEQAIVDSDNDGLPDYRDFDDDGDSVPTGVESWDGDRDPRNDDTDRDGFPDYLDDDDDGDGLLTIQETLDSQGTLDVDGDGRPDHIDRLQQAPEGLQLGPEPVAEDPPEDAPEPTTTARVETEPTEDVEMPPTGAEAPHVAESAQESCGGCGTSNPGGAAGILAAALLMCTRRRAASQS